MFLTHRNVDEILAIYTTESPDTLNRDDIYWSDAAYKAREQRQARAG